MGFDPYWYLDALQLKACYCRIKKPKERLLFNLMKSRAYGNGMLPVFPGLYTDIVDVDFARLRELLFTLEHERCAIAFLFRESDNKSTYRFHPILCKKGYELRY